MTTRSYTFEQITEAAIWLGKQAEKAAMLAEVVREMPAGNPAPLRLEASKFAKAADMLDAFASTCKRGRT